MPAPVPVPVTAQAPVAPAARREETETALAGVPASQPQATLGQRFRSLLIGAPLPQDRSVDVLLVSVPNVVPGSSPPRAPT